MDAPSPEVDSHVGALDGDRNVGGCVNHADQEDSGDDDIEEGGSIVVV